MTDIPETPREFFLEYLPARFAEFRAALAGRSSPGSMSFTILGEGTSFGLKLASGELVVSEGNPTDALLAVAVTSEDFAPVIVTGARRAAKPGAAIEHQLLAFKVLTAEPDRVGVLKTVSGTVSVVLGDGAVTRSLHLGIGAEPNPAAAQCKLECGLGDFLAAIGGEGNPFQLLMDGKLRVTGNMQIPMVLAGLLA